MLADRQEAGRLLAQALAMYAHREDVRLFALPRGGVVVGAEVAKSLGLPLDLIITRKIGAPYNEEYAIGAYAETGELIWNEEERAAADPQGLERIVADEKKEAERRAILYRHGRPLIDLSGFTAVIIDDGLATGLTMRAAIAAAKHQHAQHIIVAIPHGAKESIQALRSEVDQVVALDEPEFYGSVGAYYELFPQVEDQIVLSLMKTYGPTH